MTVLVLAPERDTTADRMIRELAGRRARVVRFDTAWFPEHVSLDAEFRRDHWDSRLTIRDRTVAMTNMSSTSRRGQAGSTRRGGSLRPLRRRHVDHQ